MAWSITPTDATIDSNGNATITSRTTSDKVYTITYTDTNGCTASTTYTLKGYNCDDDVHINSTIPTLSSAGTSVQVGTYTSEAHDYISFTPTDNWLHLTAETNGNISMSADTNTDPERSTSVKVSMNGSDCTTFNVTQEAGEQSCSCDEFEVNPRFGGIWEWNSYGSANAITTTTSNKEINVYPKNENTIDTAKTGAITFKGTDCEPSRILLLTQQVKSSPTEEIVITIALAYYDNNTLAYGYYTTSNGESAPFNIVMTPSFGTKQISSSICPQAVTWIEKTLPWESSGTQPDPSGKNSVWTTQDGYVFCNKQIYEVRANGSVVNMGDTITYLGQTYKIMWAL